MSLTNPANQITRWSVVGMEGMWAKMFDPPTTSPATTDQITLVPQGLIRPCPVPEVMFAAGLQDRITRPHTFQHTLLHGLTETTWDGRNLQFMTIGMPDVPAADSGTYPGATLRMPRGVIFNSEVQGKGPPPHTIHWHGLEPTPINDGVGHCSMELGQYIYQFQPNFMGTYFAHCHRNTMQHFEFGLYFALIFEAPDAYFGSIASSDANGSNVVLRDLTQFPIGGGRDGKRRVACNLDNPLNGLPRFTQFPGFNRRPIDSPDDQALGANDTNIRFPTDPHAMTVTFDVESLMVFDDRDLNWSDFGKNARQTYPAQGTMPGINDNFKGHAGGIALPGDFFAFNDFNAAYWFVTGVPVPAAKGGTATLPENVVIPTALNSGIIGTQVSINAQTGQTILVRCLNAAYNVLRLTFPVDIVTIAWDGRALGVAPFAHNESYLVEAGTPIEMSVARRFDALISSNVPFSGVIKAEFIDHQSMSPDFEVEEVVMTALVPINIGGNVQPPPVFAFIGKVVDQLNQPVQGCTITVHPASLTGSPLQTVVTDDKGEYRVEVIDGTYEFNPSIAGKIFLTPTRVLTCRGASGTVEVIVASVANFEPPGGYTLPDALDSLREVVGLNPKPTPDFKKFRYDVAPFLEGIPAPDSIIDIRDSLNILRMVVGLPPR